MPTFCQVPISDYQPRLNDQDGDINKTWCIDYRIWDTDKKEFVRKRYTGMNKFRTAAERYRHSKKKLKEIVALLSEGYTTGHAPAHDAPINLQRASVAEAVRFAHDSKKGSLSPETVGQYDGLVKRVEEHPPFNSLAMAHLQPTHVLEWLSALQKKKKFGAKTYNDYLNNFSTYINFFVRLDLLNRNVCRNLQRQQVEKSEMHHPYSEEQRQAIKKAIIEAGEHQLLLFISFIYYTFTRSGKELRLLQIKDIRKSTIYIPSTRAKNNRGEHVTIAPPLEALIQEHDLRSYPPDYYVFTAQGNPGPVPAGVNYFYKRHNKILEAIGLDGQQYTVYGYKHTGAINLYQATKDIELVRQHCRHTHAGQTATYLRELGILRNEEALQNFPAF